MSSVLRRRGFGHLLVEQRQRVLPHTGRLVLGERQERRQQIVREPVRRLARQQGRQVVDGDHVDSVARPAMAIRNSSEPIALSSQGGECQETYALVFGILRIGWRKVVALV